MTPLVKISAPLCTSPDSPGAATSFHLRQLGIQENDKSDIWVGLYNWPQSTHSRSGEPIGKLRLSAETSCSRRKTR
jgi:hypothetical protein